MMEGARGWSGAWHSPLSGEKVPRVVGRLFVSQQGVGAGVLSTRYDLQTDSSEARVHRSPKRPERPEHPKCPEPQGYRTNAAPAHLTSMTSPQ